MADGGTASSRRDRARLWRWGLAIGIVAALLAAGTFLGSPALVGKVVKDALTTDAANEINLGAIRFNPVTGRGSLRDLSIKTPSGGELSIARAQFDIDVSDLVNHRVRFQDLRIDDAHFEFERADNGWVLAGWGPLGDAKAPSAGSRWIVGIESMEIRKARIRYRQGELAETADIELLRLSDVRPWTPLSESAFEMKGTAAGGHIAAKGTMTPFAKILRIAGEFRLASLRLNSLVPLASPGSVDRVGGMVHAELKLDLRRARDGGLEGHMSGPLSLDDVEAAVGDMSVGFKKAHWAGDVKFSTTAQAKSAPPTQDSAGAGTAAENVRIDGTLAAEVAQWEGPYPPGRQRVTAENVTLDDLRGEFAMGAAGHIRATLGGNARIKALQSRDPVFNGSSELVEWNGSLSYAEGEDGGTSASADGRARYAKSILEWLPAGLVLRQEAVQWAGKVDVARANANAPSKLVMEADSQVTGLSLDSKRLRQRVIDLGTLEAKRLRLGPNVVLAFDEMTATELRALQAEGDAGEGGRRGPRPALALKKLTVERVEMPTPARITAKRVAFDGSTTRIVRNADGRFDLVEPVLSLGKPSRAEGEGQARQGQAATPDERSATFAVGEVVIGEGSRLVFEDRSVEPPVRLAAAPFSARIGAVDSAEPAADSPFALSATFGGYGQLDAKGTVRPFASHLTLEAEGTLKSFDLPVISSYVSRNLGYALTRGRLDADVRVSVNDGQLHAGSKLVLSKLQVEAPDTADARALREKLDVPLEKGLSLLRDSDDVIHLSLPVSGNIDNPQFDFSDAINQAVGNAIRNTILTTFKFAIPIVGLISILHDAGESKLQFNPVPFEAGSADLGPAGITYLGELGKMLTERPGVTLSVCGRATDGDRDALAKRAAEAAAASPPQGTPVEAAPRSEDGDDGTAPSPGATPPAGAAPAGISDERLMRLANRRARLVKDHLVETRHVSHERVFICSSKIDTKAGAAPRVEVLM